MNDFVLVFIYMKLQITLTKQEEELLSSKAGMLGYDVTKYVKYLLAKEAVSAIPPIFKMNDAQVEKIEMALQEEDDGKTLDWKFGENEN